MIGGSKENQMSALEVSHPKRCIVYLPFERDDALIVPYAVDESIGYYEMGEYFERCPASDAIRLGKLTKKQFNNSERRNVPQRTGRIPDYRLSFSKLRSNKQFEREYACYHAKGANSANIIIVFESPKILRKPLYVGASCNAFDEVAIGNTLIELHDFYRRSVHRPKEATV